MFMSESYMHIREDISQNDFLDISITPRWMSKNEARSISQSALELNQLKETQDKMRTKSLNNLNYDGDTDSIGEGDEIRYNDVLLKCSICDIEFNIYFDFPQSSFRGKTHGELESVDHFTGRKSKKYKKRRKNQEERKNLNINGINLEEYKDWAHRMEQFDPEAERKWTLEYDMDEKPRLSKIIIGRGHKNAFPELNNILLFDEVKGYGEAEWRNQLLQDKRKMNEDINSKYSLLPAKNTCLFCFSERQEEISKALRENRPLVKAFVTCNESVNREDGVFDVRTMTNEDTGKMNGNNSSKVNGHREQKWRLSFKPKLKSKSLRKLMSMNKPKKIEPHIEEEPDEDEEFEVLEFDGVS